MPANTDRKPKEDESENAAHLASSDAKGHGTGSEKPFGAIPILVLLILVIGGVWLMHKMRDMGNVQDCVWAGRKNCAPVDVPP